MAGASNEREPLLASGAPSGVQPSNGPLVIPTAETDHGTFSSDDRLPGNSSSADAERQDDENVDEARRRQYEGNVEARKQLKYILPAVGVGVWLAAADSTVVVSAYGAIGSDLHELNKTAWIAQSYFLTLTSFQPLCGKLSDIFGRKTILLFSYIIFGIGCLWCGLAQSMDSLIAARALAGIGGGGMNTVVSILISDIVPLNERGMWQGIINIVWAVGTGMGAPLGGILADSIGWRIAFIAQAPLCLVAFISCYFALQIKRPEEEEEDDEQNGGKHWTSKLRRIDFLGALTLVLAVTLLLVGLDRGSNVAWSDTATITTLAVCIPMLVAFVYVETRVAAEPFAPGRVIFGRSMIGAFGCNFFCVMGWYSVMFYVPLYLQGVKQMTATAAGVRLLPALIFTVIGSLAGGIIMRKTGRYYALNLAGFATLVLACVVLTLSTGPPLRSVPGIMVALALGGLGGGSGVTTSLIALIANADPADQAVATACSYLFRSLGSVLGLSFVSSLLQLQLRDKLMDRLDGGHGGRAAQEIVERVRQSLSAIDELPASTAEIVRATYGESIRECFGVIVIFVFFSFFSALFVREKRLNK